MAEANEKPLILIASDDFLLSKKVGAIVTELKFRSIRTNSIDRIIRELKRPGRCIVVDICWEQVQEPGVLRQLVNIAAITEGKVICICPNKDEDLKLLAKRSRVSEIFIRYDLEVAFKDYMAAL